MKCPHCDKTLGSTAGNKTTVSGVNVVILYCPHCLHILGVANA